MRRYYWLAADGDQGALAIDAIAGFVERTPTLAGRVEIQSRRVVAPDTGASLDVLAADAAGAWGLRPTGVFVDELAQWMDTPQPRRLWEAVSTAVAKHAAAEGPGAGGPSPRDVLATLRIEDGRLWIDAAADFQLADALAVLEGERPYHYLTRARGASKTTDLAAVALALLLAGRERPGALLCVLTTAGEPSHFSAEILEHAQGSPLWRVHEVPGPAPWMAEDRLAEQRARLTESAYARLFLNRWTEAEDRLTTADDLAACSTLPTWPLPARHGVPYVVTADVGLKADRTVVAVTHPEDREDAAGHRVVLDRIATWQGTRAEPVQLDQVEAYILQVVRDYQAGGICLDPYQAAQLAQRLRARGLRVDEFAFTAQSVGKLGAGLYTTLRDHALALPPADNEEPEAGELHSELRNVRLRETSPGVYRLDHDHGRHDDRAIALALAVQWWREHLVPVADEWDEDAYLSDRVSLGPDL